MCVAIQEMMEDSRIEGRIEGKIEGRIEGRIEGKIEGAVEAYKEFNLSLQETVQRIADKFNLPLQRAEEEAKKYWK